MPVPRQPECSSAASLPSRGIRKIGRQSATVTHSTSFGVPAITPSAGSGCVSGTKAGDHHAARVALRDAPDSLGSDPERSADPPPCGRIAHVSGGRGGQDGAQRYRRRQIDDRRGCRSAIEDAPVDSRRRRRQFVRTSRQTAGMSRAAMASFTRSPTMKGVSPHCRIGLSQPATLPSHNSPGM